MPATTTTSGRGPTSGRRLGGAQGDPRLPAGAGDLAEHGARVAPGQLGRVVVEDGSIVAPLTPAPSPASRPPRSA